MTDLLDTSAARAAIMQRIRQRQQRDPAAKEGELRAAQAYMLAPDAAPLPSLPADLLQHFCQQAEKMSVSLELLASVQEVPAAAARYLQRQQLPMQANIWPQWQDLPWQESGIQVDATPIRDGALVGITGSFCAVAETGSLMLLSSEHEQISSAILPETHIAIVYADRIVGRMEQAFALALQERGILPRTATFISGPSRTGDIEQTIVLGAHGPYRVHVLIVTEAQTN